jgi:DNA-binding response OmpR family regulator
MRILIVEDEYKLAQALKQGLENEHYQVKLAETGEEGFFLAHSETFDLMILDLMLPGCDGQEALSALRGCGLTTPVLIVSARDTLEDRIHGLDAGADDYLVKPFALAELLARVRALIRRGRADEILRFKAADLELDRVTHKVSRGGQTLDLTAREFELLEYLLLHQDRAVSREMLARDIWREVRRATPLDNVIDVHMARLRRKVDGAAEHKLIHTLRGVGFMLSEEAP